MPIYEYKCQSCGDVSEVLQKMSDKPLTKCKKCSGALEKLISRSSFQLKGSGWYVTDYGRKKSGDSGKSGSGSEGGSSSKSDSDSGKKSSAPADSGKAASAASGAAGRKPSKSSSAD